MRAVWARCLRIARQHPLNRTQTPVYMATECKGSLMDAICFQLKPPFKPPYLTSEIQHALSFWTIMSESCFCLCKFKAPQKKCTMYMVSMCSLTNKQEYCFIFALKGAVCRMLGRECESGETDLHFSAPKQTK